MKRLYVISDSHGYRDFDMLLAASRDADAYAHLGDHVLLTERWSWAPPAPATGTPILPISPGSRACCWYAPAHFPAFRRSMRVWT